MHVPLFSNIRAAIKHPIAIEHFFIVWNVLLLAVLVWYQSVISQSLLFALVIWFLFLISAIRVPVAAWVSVLIATIIFERWFALVPITVGGTVFKIYSLDIALLLIVIAVVVPVIFRFELHAWLHDIWKKIRTSAVVRFDIAMGVWFLIVTALALFGLRFSTNAAGIGSAWKNYAAYALVWYAVSTYFLRLHVHADQYRRIVVQWLLAVPVVLLLFPVLGVLQGSGVWATFTPLSTYGSRLLAAPHSFFFGFIFLGLFAYSKSTLPFPPLLRKWFGSTWWKILIASTLLLGLYRNIWLATAVGVGVISFLFTSIRRWRLSDAVAPVLVVLISGLLVANTMLWYYGDRMESMVQGNAILSSIQTRVLSLVAPSAIGADESAGWRVAAWSAALSEWWGTNWSDRVSHILIGVGMGERVSFSFQDFAQDVGVTSLHNDWLAVLVQMGFVGVFGIVFVFIEAFRLVTNARRHASPLFAWSAGSVAYAITAAMFGMYMGTNMLGMWLWVWLAMLAAVVHATMKEV